MKTITAHDVRRIYSASMAEKYDQPISHMFKAYKNRAFKASTLKPGARVLVFCCGTGLDFEAIIRKTGLKGVIVGVDFSAEMLRIARKKIEKHAWRNVRLVNADVTTFEDHEEELFDAGICTLGLSVIPDFEKAYRNLVNHVKPGGEIIIGDMQLANGFFSLLNGFTVHLAKRFGGTVTGHGNSLRLQELMEEELVDVTKRFFFLGSYFYCLGRKRG